MVYVNVLVCAIIFTSQPHHEILTLLKRSRPELQRVNLNSPPSHQLNLVELVPVELWIAAIGHQHDDIGVRSP